MRCQTSGVKNWSSNARSNARAPRARIRATSAAARAAPTRTRAAVNSAWGGGGARWNVGLWDRRVGGGRGRHDLLAGQSRLAGSVPVAHGVPLDGDGELGEIARDVLQIFEGPDRYRLRPEAPEVEPAFDLD